MKKNKNNKTEMKGVIKKIIKKIFLRFYKDITILGGTYFYILTVLILLILQQYSYAAKLTIAWIIVMFISITIRYFYFKPRPKKKEYSNIIEKIDASSFPSMHASRSIILTLFLIEYTNNFTNINFNSIIMLKILILFLGINIGISRIILKKHYFIDIIAGWTIGLITYILLF